MDLQTRKLAFIQEFIKLSNEEAISKFEDLLKLQKSRPDNPPSEDELILRVEMSEEDFRNGNFKTSQELRKKFG